MNIYCFLYRYFLNQEAKKYTFAIFIGDARIILRYNPLLTYP